jgi:hypothetical protein
VQSGKERGDADVSTAFMGMSRQAGRVAGSAGGCCCLKQRGSGCLVVPRVDPAALFLRTRLGLRASAASRIKTLVLFSVALFIQSILLLNYFLAHSHTPACFSFVPTC